MDRVKNLTPSFLAVKLQKLLKEQQLLIASQLLDQQPYRPARSRPEKLPDVKLSEAQMLLAGLFGFTSWHELVVEFPSRAPLLMCEKKSIRLDPRKNLSLKPSSVLHETCAYFERSIELATSPESSLRATADELDAAVNAWEILSGYMRESSLDRVGLHGFRSPVLHIAYASERVGNQRLIIHLGLAPVFFVSIERDFGRKKDPLEDWQVARISSDKLFPGPNEIKVSPTRSLHEILRIAASIADQEKSKLLSAFG